MNRTKKYSDIIHCTKCRRFEGVVNDGPWEPWDIIKLSKEEAIALKLAGKIRGAYCGDCFSKELDKLKKPLKRGINRNKKR